MTLVGEKRPRGVWGKPVIVLCLPADAALEWVFSEAGWPIGAEGHEEARVECGERGGGGEAGPPPPLNCSQAFATDGSTKQPHSTSTR